MCVCFSLLEPFSHVWFRLFDVVGSVPFQPQRKYNENTADFPIVSFPSVNVAKCSVAQIFVAAVAAGAERCRCW